MVEHSSKKVVYDVVLAKIQTHKCINGTKDKSTDTNVQSKSEKTKFNILKING